MDVSELMGFPAAKVDGAEASPPEMNAPDEVLDQAVAPVDSQPVHTDPAVDVDAIVQARLAEIETQRQAQEQRAEEARQAQIRTQMRQQENQNWLGVRKELTDEGLVAVADKIQAHRSFLSQERDEAMMERDLMAKANDALVAILQDRFPGDFEGIVADAKTLMPYSSYDEMQGSLGQRRNLTSAKDAEIARLNQQLNEIQTQLGVTQRPESADRVESGGTGIPVQSGVSDYRKATSLDEWAMLINAQRR